MGCELRRRTTQEFEHFPKTAEPKGNTGRLQLVYKEGDVVILLLDEMFGVGEHLREGCIALFCSKHIVGQHQDFRLVGRKIPAVAF